jgi:glucan phosphoethanolaminetransferase (alkaline phosphatase superfamily)
MNIAKAHLIFGVIVFVVFLITGRFMRADFPDKEFIPQEFRLMMRSRHIYILFAALLHILLGLYLQIALQKWRKYLQIFGSFLLTLGSALLIWAFVYETYATKQFSDVSRFGLYFMLAGTAFHLFSRFR